MQLSTTQLKHQTALPSRRRHHIGRQLIPWLVPLMLLIVWQITAQAGVLSASVLPAPTTVLQDGIALTQSGELPRNLAVSLFRATTGFAIGAIVGFVLALLTGLSTTWRLALDSSVQMVRNIPHLSLIPLVIIWFGIGEPAKITLVAIGVFFPVYINTFHGLASVDPELLEMGHVYGLTRWQQFRQIIFPSALPTILVGIRYALGVMWTTLIVAETVSTSSGIGYMSTNAQDFLDMKTILLCIIIYALLGKLSDTMVKALERQLLSWQKGNVA